MTTDTERLLRALHQCYAATGEEAGEFDDFRALTDCERITVQAVQQMRRELDAHEAKTLTPEAQITTHHPMKNTTQTNTDHDLRLAALAKAAPFIAVETIWSHDDCAKWDFEDPTMQEDDYQAWQSEVKVSAIVAGQMVSGSAYLGGTWEKFGEHPRLSNPDISGYFPQMLDEALEELANLCEGFDAIPQAIAQARSILATLEA